MRTLQRFTTVCFIGAAFAALISACGSSDATPPTGGAGAGTAGAQTAGAAGAVAAAGAGTAGAGTAGGSGLTGNAANGMTLYSATTVGCSACHGTMGEGLLGPNITGSKTAGIGNWTQTQFHDAVRSGKDKSGAQLYFLMPPLDAATISDQGIADVYAFLMTKMNDTVNAGSSCTMAPGMCKGTH